MTQVTVKQFSKNTHELISFDQYEFSSTENALKFIQDDYFKMIKTSIRFEYTIREL